MIYDFLAFAGVVALCAGIYAQWGWPFAVMAGGVVLIVAGILGAINDTKQTTESSD